MGKERNCIYCVGMPNFRGEGDHVLPAAFGEFDGDVRFRAICESCNHEIGHAEEELLRCGPESIIKSFVAVKSKRTKKRGNSNAVGAHGVPPPESRIDMGDHTALVKRDPNNPRDTTPVDQFVVRCPDGQDRSVKLFKGMRPTQLIERVEKLGCTVLSEAWWHSSDDSWVSDLVNQAYPSLHHEERDTTPVGIHQVSGTIKTVVSRNYYRAYAKLALHYYLVWNQRGLIGQEPCFRAIRQFIRYDEGEIDDFFNGEGPKLISKMGMEVEGGQYRPTEWGHLFAAMDSDGKIHIEITLFAGPEIVLKPHRVFLGKIPAIFSPCPGFAHVFKYENMTENKRYSGKVYQQGIRRVN